MDEEFNEVSYKLIKHTIFGELKKDIQGIHLLSDLNRNIKSVTRISDYDKNGVWIANIEYYSKERKRSYFKTKSTMFPVSWNSTLFIFKVYLAFKVKFQSEHDLTIFHSKTDCGIRVDFKIVDNEMKSVYPIYEN